MAIPSVEHDRAVERLDSAVTERTRRTDDYVAAAGTDGELSASVALYAATEDVAARDAWLKWVDDESYHGLNAGPFAVRSEDEDSGKAGSTE
jgi:hypothetical protein